MKASKFIKESGPYEVVSISQDGHGVRLEVSPAFPDYDLTEERRSQKYVDQCWKDDPRWSVNRYKGNGGGPGIFTCMALASEFERFLNQCYTEDEVNAWKATNAFALKDVRAKEQRKFNRAMKRLEAKHIEK